MNPPIDDMRLLGQLLRCPIGEKAQEVGDYLFASNSQMIYTTIDSLILHPNIKLLEIGFGNGKHLPYLFAKEADLQYVGAEISAAMVAEAIANNRQRMEEGRVSFCQTAPDELPMQEAPFELCFSVNTIYFIDDLLSYCKAIYEILAPQGKAVFTFIDKAVLEKAPFAKEGFRLYTPEEIAQLFMQVGFKVVTQKSFQEVLSTKSGKKITRYYWVVTGEK